MRNLAKICVAIALTISSGANAATFSKVVAFGDGLADVGNVFAATGGAIPAPPYSNGRFSDGPVWVEGLTAGLGLPALQPALLGGSSYAFGGARTGVGVTPTPGTLAQIAGLYLPSVVVADPLALYVISGSLGDLRDARTAAQTDSAADVALRQAAAEAAAANVVTAAAALYNAGARYIAISNVYDLGATPEAMFLGLEAASSDVTSRYNSALLSAQIGALGAMSDLNLYNIDLFGLFQAITNDALTNGGAIYGITNVLTPCGSFPNSAGVSCATSLYSDALHPSAKSHQMISADALEVVRGGDSAVPEPETWALMICGFGAIGLISRRRRNRVAEA